MRRCRAATVEAGTVSAPAMTMDMTISDTEAPQRVLVVGATEITYERYHFVPTDYVDITETEPAKKTSHSPSSPLFQRSLPIMGSGSWELFPRGG